jgi:hypothetical protein
MTSHSDTYDDLLMRFFRGQLTLDQWAVEANLLYPVPGTPAKTVLRPLA